jgi:hypothetical protein
VETREHFRPLSDFGQELRLGVLGDIGCDLEVSTCTCTFCVHDALWYSLTVEVPKLLQQVDILEKDRTALSSGLTVLIIANRHPKRSRKPSLLPIIAHVYNSPKSTLSSDWSVLGDCDIHVRRHRCEGACSLSQVDSASAVKGYLLQQVLMKDLNPINRLSFDVDGLQRDGRRVHP